MPRGAGLWRVDAPAISQNSISYRDDVNVELSGAISTTESIRQLYGISYFQLYVPDVVDAFSFLPDYNARYTVLAGDSYLKE